MISDYKAPENKVREYEARGKKDTMSFFIVIGPVLMLLGLSWFINYMLDSNKSIIGIIGIVLCSGFFTITGLMWTIIGVNGIRRKNKLEDLSVQSGILKEFKIRGNIEDEDSLHYAIVVEYDEDELLNNIREYESINTQDFSSKEQKMWESNLKSAKELVGQSKERLEARNLGILNLEVGDKVKVIKGKKTDHLYDIIKCS